MAVLKIGGVGAKIIELAVNDKMPKNNLFGIVASIQTIGLGDLGLFAPGLCLKTTGGVWQGLIAC